MGRQKVSTLLVRKTFHGSNRPPVIDAYYEECLGLRQSASRLRGSWGKGAEVTLSGCLSEGSGSRNCCVSYTIYPGFEKLDVKLKLGRCERCLGGVVKGLGLWGW